MNIEELARLFAEASPPRRLPDLDQTASVEVDPERTVDESSRSRNRDERAPVGLLHDLSVVR